jgi:hypothetical protein
MSRGAYSDPRWTEKACIIPSEDRPHIRGQQERSAPGSGRHMEKQHRMNNRRQPTVIFNITGIEVFQREENLLVVLRRYHELQRLMLITGYKLMRVFHLIEIPHIFRHQLPLMTRTHRMGHARRWLFI